jgi:hypothetical protein
MAKDVESVKEIATLVVEPIVVDEVSLIKPGPVRVQGRCRTPSLIKGSIEIFFNGTRIPIGFELEDGKGTSKGGKGALQDQDLGIRVGVLIKITTSIFKMERRGELTSSRDLGI